MGRLSEESHRRSAMPAAYPATPGDATSSACPDRHGRLRSFPPEAIFGPALMPGDKCLILRAPTRPFLRDERVRRSNEVAYRPGEDADPASLTKLATKHRIHYT